MPHTSRRYFMFLLFTFVVALKALPPGQVLAAPHDIYIDSLAANWVNYSWATH